MRKSSKTELLALLATLASFVTKVNQQYWVNLKEFCKAADIRTDHFWANYSVMYTGRIRVLVGLGLKYKAYDTWEEVPDTDIWIPTTVAHKAYLCFLSQAPELTQTLDKLGSIGIADIIVPDRYFFFVQQVVLGRFPGASRMLLRTTRNGLRFALSA